MLKKIKSKIGDIQILIYKIFSPIASLNSKDLKTLLILTGFIKPDGEPKRCTICFSKEFEVIGTDYIANITCEADLRCKKCKTKYGSFAYGHWKYRY